jgi:hypothetical protein
MAAVAFDSLHHAHQLEAAGMPREQAELVAQGLSAMFVHNFDSLVTKDYLDTRFSEQSVKMDLLAAEVDHRLDLFSAEVDGKFDRFSAEFDGKLGRLSADFDGKLDRLSVGFDGKLDRFSVNFCGKLDLLSAETDGKLGKLYVMFGVIMAGLSIPIIQTLITWLS